MYPFVRKRDNANCWACAPTYGGGAETSLNSPLKRDGAHLMILSKMWKYRKPIGDARFPRNPPGRPMRHVQTWMIARWGFAANMYPLHTQTRQIDFSVARLFLREKRQKMLKLDLRSAETHLTRPPKLRKIPPSLTALSALPASPRNPTGRPRRHRRHG